MSTVRLDENRWVSCSQDAGYMASLQAHVVVRGSLDSLCGCSASHPEVWRGDKRKPKCPACDRVLKTRIKLAT